MNDLETKTCDNESAISSIKTTQESISRASRLLSKSIISHKGNTERHHGSTQGFLDSRLQDQYQHLLERVALIGEDIRRQLDVLSEEQGERIGALRAQVEGHDTSIRSHAKLFIEHDIIGASHDRRSARLEQELRSVVLDQERQLAKLEDQVAKHRTSSGGPLDVQQLLGWLSRENEAQGREMQSLRAMISDQAKALHEQRECMTEMKKELSNLREKEGWVS